MLLKDYLLRTPEDRIVALWSHDVLPCRFVSDLPKKVQRGDRVIMRHEHKVDVPHPYSLPWGASGSGGGDPERSIAAQYVFRADSIQDVVVDKKNSRLIGISGRHPQSRVVQVYELSTELDMMPVEVCVYFADTSGKFTYDSIAQEDIVSAYRNGRKNEIIGKALNRTVSRWQEVEGHLLPVKVQIFDDYGKSKAAANYHIVWRVDENIPDEIFQKEDFLKSCTGESEFDSAIKDLEQKLGALIKQLD